jgi:hypothetical protein
MIRRITTIIVMLLLSAPKFVISLDPIHLGLVSKAFQYTIFPIAQERGYDFRYALEADQPLTRANWRT